MRFGSLRTRMLICWQRTRFSASSLARDLKRERSAYGSSFSHSAMRRQRTRFHATCHTDRIFGNDTARPRYFPPKTKAGRRTISIPALLVTDLKRWKLQCPNSPEGLVFPAPDGAPLSREKMLRVHFYRALARARLRRVT